MGQLPLPNLPEPTESPEPLGDEKSLLKRPEPSWRVHDESDAASRAMVLINQQHIELARMCAPAMDDVVDDVMSRWAVRLGLSESRAAAYVDVGIMLTDYPALGAYLDQGHLSFEHARKLADCLYCVPEEYREQVEAELLHALRPKRPNQMAFTVGRVKKVAQ